MSQAGTLQAAEILTIDKKKGRLVGGGPSRQTAYLMVKVKVVVPVMFELLLSTAVTVIV